MSGHDDERPRRSWREIDRMREGAKREASPPRGAHAEARSKRASQAYVKQLDKLFADGSGDARGDELADAIREAHGTPGLVDVCRAYLDELGPPRDPALLSLLLDARDPRIVLPALQALLALAGAGGFEASAGLRRQVRMHVDGADNDVADAAEELLEALG